MECTAQVGEKVIITERRKHIKRGKEEMHSDAIVLPESALDSADCLFCSIYLLKHFFQRNTSENLKTFCQRLAQKDNERLMCTIYKQTRDLLNIMIQKK